MDNAPSTSSEAESWKTAWSTQSLRSSPTHEPLPTCPDTPTTKPPNLSTSTAADTGSDCILSFITLLESTNMPNKTGWTHQTASLALQTLRSPQSSGQSFDFFSHLDPKLRVHLRNAYDRRKRRGYTGDISPGPEIAMPPRANMGEVVRLIEDAINSPSSESEGQVVEAKVIEDMSVDNQVIEAIDESFKPTLQVLEDGSGSKRERSTLMAGVVGYRGAL